MQTLIDAIGSAPSDRRVKPRFQPTYGTTCRLLSDAVQTALVWDVSAYGVGLLVSALPEAGAEIPVELHTEGGGAPIATALRVTHIRPLSTGDYFVGAKFARSLTEAELDALTTPLPATPSLSVKVGSPKVKGPTSRAGLRRAAVAFANGE
jgi:hypothetical protein